MILGMHSWKGMHVCPGVPCILCNDVTDHVALQQVAHVGAQNIGGTRLAAASAVQ